ncbi:hypothetical protein ABH940_002944 [Streptacidiphilus sp. BW17]|uniref:hypothetical protein n=1 Tax=Streptacidiphilus sp. BW17 TaxID=3156274 RepID=UPI003515AA04
MLVAWWVCCAVVLVGVEVPLFRRAHRKHKAWMNGHMTEYRAMSSKERSWAGADRELWMTSVIFTIIAVVVGPIGAALISGKI